MKRSRTARSYTQLEHEATGNLQVPKAAEESSYSAARARSDSERRSTETMSNVTNQRARILPRILSPQWPRPLEIKFVVGGGFSVLQESYLDVCKYCRRVIGEDEDRYMNGGLEAYCSSECREQFNNNNNNLTEVAEEC